MAHFPRTGPGEPDPELVDGADADPVEALFEEEPDLERWRLLTEAIRLHRRALEEPDGVTRARMLQEAIQLHSRWAQSQTTATSRALDKRPKAW
jgi:hypothetical protein